MAIIYIYSSPTPIFSLFCDKFFHSEQCPRIYVIYLITNVIGMVEEGRLVLDPFVGTGSLLLAAAEFKGIFLLYILEFLFIFALWFKFQKCMANIEPQTLQEKPWWNVLPPRLPTSATRCSRGQENEHLWAGLLRRWKEKGSVFQIETVWHKKSWPFNIVSYHIKWVKTSWTGSMRQVQVIGT